MGATGRIRVGTSGWQYEHWRGPFYPESLSKARWFGFYAERFDTVEINATFYHLPRETTPMKWRAAAPPGFVYAVKASRFITHFRRLSDPHASLALFFGRMAGLMETMGPVLFQLPPRFPRDAGLLAEFLAALPAGGRHAFEFRDPSWFHEEIYSQLDGHGAAFCVFELGGLVSPVLATGEFAYVRLHGPSRKYGGDYGADALNAWAGRLTGWAGGGHDCYCYFDNDEAGFAAKNAAELKEMVRAG